MNNDRTVLYNIVVGIVCGAAFILLFLMLLRLMSESGQATTQQGQVTLQLPLLLITGVMALFATLALVAVTFSVAGLSDKTQALGLPEGSVRAAIALSLIIIFAITAIFLFNSMATPQLIPAGSVANTRGDDFAKQVFAVVGTLMTSVVSFYFASRGAPLAATTAVSTPTLTSIAPTQATIATPVVPVQIFGTDLQLVKTVKLEMAGGNAVLATNVLSNDQLVNCQIAVAPTLAVGKYDVVVTCSDGAKATLPGAFQVQ